MSAPSAPSYLLHTSQGQFFFRIRIPKDLQPIFKKREIKRAIRTTNRTVAERQAIIYAAKATELFESLQEVSLSNLNFTKMIVVQQSDGSTGYRLDPERRKEELQDLKPVKVVGPLLHHFLSFGQM